jgi:hypothetical protein
MHPMRLLLYVLALLTGFSAAEAARPVEAASTATATSQVELAEAFASAATIATAPQFDLLDTLRNDRLEATPIAAFATLPTAATPISRADLARE